MSGVTGLDMARAVARLQGRCPGVPLDGGGYSGCRGGADCPVCEGARMGAQLAIDLIEARQVASLAGRQAEAARAERDEARAEAEKLRAELIEARQWRDEAQIEREAARAERDAARESVAILRERERSLAVAERTLRAERDALRDAARALVRLLEKCDAYDCKSAATKILLSGDDAGSYCDSCAEDLQAPCGGPDEIDFGELLHAPALRTLRTLLGEG